jgi:N-carbamoylputrescine amidase
MKTIVVAGISTSSHVGKIDENLANVKCWAERAKSEGAELLCFPELGITGFWSAPDIPEGAVDMVPGSSSAFLEGVCRELDVYISAGLAEIDGDSVFMTQILVGPEGLIGKTRKTHIRRRPGVEIFDGGDELPVYEVQGCKVGILVCSDSRYPETARVLALKDAEIILVPVSEGAPWADEEEKDTAGIRWRDNYYRFLASRAIDNYVYLVVVNHAQSPGNKCPGAAFVLSPSGEVIAETHGKGVSEKMVVCKLRLSEENARSRKWRFSMRKPELYSEIVKKV